MAPGLLRVAAAACASAAWRLPSYAKLYAALRLGSTAARSALCQKTRSGREPRAAAGSVFLGVLLFFWLCKNYFLPWPLAEVARPRRPPGGGV